MIFCPAGESNKLEIVSATLDQCFNIVNQFLDDELDDELDDDDPIHQNTKSRLARSYDLLSILEDINPVLTPSTGSKLSVH